MERRQPDRRPEPRHDAEARLLSLQARGAALTPYAKLLLREVGERRPELPRFTDVW